MSSASVASAFRITDNTAAGLARFVINSSGDVGLGGNVTTNAMAGATLTALASGIVGIGTTTPGEELVVASSGETRLMIDGGAAQAPGLEFGSNGGESAILYRPANTTDLRYYNGGDKVTFTSGGNVGIGTTTPAWALTAANATKPQLALTDAGGSSNAWTFRNIANTLYIATSSYSATSSVAALAFNSSTGAATFGSPATTTLNGGLNLGTAAGFFDASGTTTMQNTNGFDYGDGTHGMRIIPGATTTLQFY